MKVTIDSSRKLNLSINVLPDKYRQHILTFKAFVIFLATLCAIAIIVLTYQIVWDATINTRELGYDVDYLTQRFQLKTIDINRKNSMVNAINDYNKIDIRQTLFLDDIQDIKDAADTTGLQLVNIKHTGDTVELQCPTSSIYNVYGVAIQTIYDFEDAIVAQERFDSVEYPPLPSPLPDYVKITIAISESA